MLKYRNARLLAIVVRIFIDGPLYDYVVRSFYKDNEYRGANTVRRGVGGTYFVRRFEIVVLDDERLDYKHDTIRRIHKNGDPLRLFIFKRETEKLDGTYYDRRDP